MKLFYSCIGRLCAYITEQLYQFEKYTLPISVGLELCLFNSEVLRKKGKLMPKTQYLIPILLLVFVSCGAALAQEPVGQTAPAAKAETEITPLKIGDRVPDELWDLYFPVVSANSDQDQYLSLGDFKEKLIILDFWATWCAPCVKSLHGLDTLQQEFKDELVVIPTSYESEQKVKHFLANQRISLPSLINQEELKEYFPHRSVPHQVWLMDRKVIAIAYSDEAIKENIEKVLQGKDLEIRSKWENLDFDPNKPLFIDGNGTTGNELQYISLFSTYIEGIDNGAIDIKSKSVAIANQTALHLYQFAFGNRLPLFTSTYNRFVLEVNDSLKQELIYPKDASRDIKDNWKKRNSFCYNLFMPIEIGKHNMQAHMLEDLNRFFGVYYGIRGDFEMRKRKCIVVRHQSSNQRKDKTNNRRDIENGNLEPYDKFHQKLAYVNRKLPIPIISEVEEGLYISKKIDVDLTNMVAVERALRDYGLVVVEDWVDIELLVISEIN